MKKILLLILLLSGSLSMFPQTHLLNQQKYWNYRDRLQGKFMFVNLFDPYDSGSGLPASIINSSNK